MFEEVLKLREVRLGQEHEDTWSSRAALGVCYMETGRLDDAMPLMEGAAMASRKHPSLLWVKKRLMDCYGLSGRTDKEIAMINEALEEKRVTLPAKGIEIASSLAQTGRVFLEVKAWADAERVVREALEIREAKQPDDWSTFNARSMLGGALLGQKKYADADPLLRGGYEGMKRRVEKMPPQSRVHLVAALDRLIELAEATNKPDEATAWREEKATVPAVSPSSRDPGKK